jgi:DNA-binding NarL/FixJ family response regulator
LEPVQVLLIDMTQLLRELLRELLPARGTVVVVAEAPARAALIPAVDESGARVVIFGDADSYASTELEQLLAARPRTRLLSVASDGRHTTLYALRPHMQELGELSPSALIDAITHDPWPGAP